MVAFMGPTAGALSYFAALSQVGLSNPQSTGGNVGVNNAQTAGSGLPNFPASGLSPSNVSSLSTSSPNLQSASGQLPSALTPQTLNALFSVQSETGTGDANGATNSLSLLSSGQGGATSTLQNGESAALHGLRGFYHHDAGADAASDSTPTGSDTSSPGSSAQQDSTQTITNANGSTTTIFSYADGSQVTTSTPATNPASSGGNTNNMLEQLFQRNVQALGPVSGQSVSLSI
jgi:hypothetical protein